MTTTVLVTGGAGYIGSHTCRQLIDAGYSVVVLDNFYSGQRWAVPKEATLVEGDVGDATLARETLTQYGVDAVIHFAGHIVVPESVENPIKYYRNNTIASCNLIQACVDVGVDKFIFSSTAAVYGIPAILPVNEDAVTAPINP
ncbi:MAG: NAD-dependent epimerase/dehydratase family protein, partial [Acidiferrobacterales bacterium]